MVLATNPGGVGEEWIIEYFSPWLDSKHPNPAQPGALRWFIRNEEGILEDVPDNTKDAKSRTYIHSSWTNNPYTPDNYEAQLSLLREPYRSQLKHGEWGVGAQDDRWQVIPTDWVRLANERWLNAVNIQRDNAVVDSIGVDVAHGGKDKTVLSKRQGSYFIELIKIPGRETPDGQAIAGLITKELRNAHKNTYVNIDGTGVGASAYDIARDAGDVRAFIAAGKSTAKDKSGKLTFKNKRAESIWLFMEALDPQTGEGIALPPDQELLADLTASRWKQMAGGVIQIEMKEEIIKRLGHSPDCGDAVVMAWHGKNESPAAGVTVEMSYGMRKRSNVF